MSVERNPDRRHEKKLFTTDTQNTIRMNKKTNRTDWTIQMVTANISV